MAPPWRAQEEKGHAPAEGKRISYEIRPASPHPLLPPLKTSGTQQPGLPARSPAATGPHTGPEIRS